MDASQEPSMTHIFQRSAVAAAAYSFFSLGLSPVWAQTEDIHRLDEVTITARNLERNDLMVPAQQLSGAALTKRQGSTLGETLDNLPGIANSSFGPNVEIGRASCRERVSSPV